MTAQPIHTPPAPAEHPLYRTVGGARLHIAECPHIIGVDVQLATAADRLAMAVCHWCRQELDGVGRTYFDTLEDAMRDFGTHAGTEPLIRDALRFVDWDQIWVPYSRSYIALGREGLGVAWVGKTYVELQGGTFVELPDYVAGSGGGAERHDRVGHECPKCHLTMPLTGRCDGCD
jgi:hypothetical protein